MNKPYSITKLEERNRNQRLGPEERGATQSRKKIGFLNRAIAREITCCPSTVGYELRAEPRNTLDVGVNPATLQSAGRKYLEQIEPIAVAPKSILQTLLSFAGR